MSENDRRIELVTGTARRRYRSKEQKLRVIGESFEPGETFSSVVRRNGVAANLLCRWRRLMSEGAEPAPHPVEHLSGNGSPYTANETRNSAAALNLVRCFTPVTSPESNGLSEAFVKTFKRDRVRVNPLPDAAMALRQIAGWIDDYNAVHPHSTLRMRSPKEPIRAQAQ